MDILLAILLTVLTLVFGILFAHADFGMVDRIEALIKERGGRDVFARPFGHRVYEVTYRDANGAERKAYCYFAWDGKIYLGEACE